MASRLLVGLADIVKGKTEAAPHKTEARLLTDGTTLYIRITAEHPAPVFMAKSGSEAWPLGDHVEIRFEKGARSWCFAVDGNGNHYDSLNSDRRWSSGWKVLASDSGGGAWRALLAIPLKALEIEPENRKTFPSFLMIRREKYGAGTPESTPGGVFPGKRQAALAF